MARKVYQITLSETDRMDYLAALAMRSDVEAINGHEKEARHFAQLASELVSVKPSPAFGGTVK